MADNNAMNNIALDESLPMEELLKNAKTNTKKKPEEQPKTEGLILDSDEFFDEEDDEDVIEPDEEVTPQPKKKTALELMKEQKAKAGSGMIISNKDLEASKTEGVNGNMFEETRVEQFDETLKSMDELIEKRNAVTLIKSPTNELEYLQMMDELDAVRKVGNKFVLNVVNDNGDPIEPKYIRIKEEGEKPFDEEAILKKNPELRSAVEQKKAEAGIVEEAPTEISKESTEDEADEKKKKIVEILIDKTGFGSDFKFTDEEKEKIEDSYLIKLKEVKTLDLATIHAKRSDKSFQQAVKEFNLNGSRSTICFPASGFRAQMKGLTYGEYVDVQLSMDNVTFDQYYKRLSIIYNKMTNISTGPFEDFEDFLKHFAYTDIYLALYALFVATEPEDTEISLSCGADGCKKGFNWKYNTRSILRLDRCPEYFLEKMEAIASADAADFDKIKSEAAVNTSKIIELPDSHIACEIGVASAYDFLYNFIPLMDENTFREAFGPDEHGVYMANALFLTTVRAVYVPDGSGQYIECHGYKDILDALYNITPTEFQILSAYASKIQECFNCVFSFGDVVCPHCKTVTKDMDISIDELVFRTYQQLMNTDVDLDSIQAF